MNDFTVYAKSYFSALQIQISIKSVCQPFNVDKGTNVTV